MLGGATNDATAPVGASAAGAPLHEVPIMPPPIIQDVTGEPHTTLDKSCDPKSAGEVCGAKVAQD